MNLSTQSISVVLAIFLFVLIFTLLRKGRLKERHVTWWLFGAFFALVISIFPQLLSQISELLGFEVPSNLVFFISIFLLFLSGIQQSSEITRLEDKTRILSEKIALLEFEISKKK